MPDIKDELKDGKYATCMELELKQMDKIHLPSTLDEQMPTQGRFHLYKN